MTDSPPAPGPAPVETKPAADLTLEQIYAVLKECHDPEIPVNIVDLGLIYGVRLEENGRVLVRMTLTTPGCSMGGSITENARAKILGLPGVREATVEIVWDPPWTQHMISEAGRRRLGLA